MKTFDSSSMNSFRKGVSPLIAAVVLIAFTISIAFIVANWATSFVGSQTEAISSEAQCIGALYAEIPVIVGNQVSVRVSNFNPKINLTDLKISVTYSDPSENIDTVASTVTNLGPGDTKTITHDTTKSIKPVSVRVTASNCPGYPKDVFFN